MVKKQNIILKPQTIRPLRFTIIFLIILSIFAMFIASTIESIWGETGNTAIIPIEGVISDGQGLSVGSADEVLKFLNDANENPKVEAIILKINSPGGTAVASEEIARAIAKSDKLTVAWIREVGASGGYWVASSADVIVASPLSITGSIGVIGSYLDFSEFLEEYNVSYQRLVSGEFKDMGTPFKELTPAERLYLEKTLDEMRDYFVAEVATNRNLSFVQVDRLADGRIYLGSKAKELGLVDVLGNQQEVLQVIEDTLNITVTTYEYKRQPTVFNLLSGFNSKQGLIEGLQIKT
ncbi:signal peptide peptidase SppA [Candidatus Woesearchaeota archaeon]|nr:signal peptide peptidase SppA [Candidatus Woesearchaeota archaeon]